jgi:hypothetical protein
MVAVGGIVIRSCITQKRMSTRHFGIAATGGEGGGESAATVLTIVITGGTKGLGSATSWPRLEPRVVRLALGGKTIGF